MEGRGVVCCVDCSMICILGTTVDQNCGKGLWGDLAHIGYPCWTNYRTLTLSSYSSASVIFCLE